MSTTTEKTNKWYVVDDATKRTAPSPDSDKYKQDLAAMKKAGLSEEIIASARKAHETQQAASKAFALAISRAQQSGKCDLIQVSGGFKAKQLSPRLLRELVDNAEFVRQYLDTVFAQDD